jgi:hypothetical protein
MGKNTSTACEGRLVCINGMHLKRKHEGHKQRPKYARALGVLSQGSRK